VCVCVRVYVGGAKRSIPLDLRDICGCRTNWKEINKGNMMPRGESGRNLSIPLELRDTSG